MKKRKSTPKNLRPEFRNLSLESGTLIGRYTIVKKLASGGFGMVYQARRSDGEMVAIKEFLPAVLPCRIHHPGEDVQFSKPGHRTRFQEGLTAFFREADTLSKLHLPYVVSIWDVFEAHGTAYFAMPLEPGMTLRHWAYRSIPTPDTARIVRLVMSACDGVQSLHEQGLLHLDIKPGNLWVRPDQGVLVLDLGASRWEDEEGRMSHLARTPGFAAPEQHGVQDARVLTVKTDIYGLASTLLCCLEQQSPPSALIRRHKDPPLSRQLAGRHSPQLLDAIAKGMALKPADRPMSIAKWKEQLGNALPGGLMWGNSREIRIQETPPPALILPRSI